MPHLQDHLLLGHGYQTFWNQGRIAAFSQAHQYSLSDGHCAYLDTALDLGLVGAAICLVSVIAGIRVAASRYRVQGDIGYSFLFALLACRSLNALLESNFAAPTSFVPFVMVCGLTQLGFFRKPDESYSLFDYSHETPRWISR
jgi:O-antigen ligase